MNRPLRRMIFGVQAKNGACRRTFEEKENGTMIDTPLISVIVPVYKTEQFLDRCLQSVLGQTYTHWEILLIDDYRFIAIVVILKAFQ